MTMSTLPEASPLTVASWSFRAHEPRQEADGQRERGEALGERLEVLTGEHGGRHEHGDLLAVLRRLEGGSQRDLGLAVADVADDQPVHGPARLHVDLDLFGGPQLVGRLLVRERRLHLALPRRVRRIREPLGRLALGVQRKQLLREVADRLADALLGPQPVRAAKPAQGRVLPARVAADAVDLLDRDEDPVAGRERELEVVALLARLAAPQHLLVACDAVVDVDDDVAGREALEEVAGDDAAHRLGAPDPDRAEQLAVRDEGEAVGAALEAAVEAPLDQGDGAGRRGLGDAMDDADGVPGLAKQLREPRRLIAGQDDPRLLPDPVLDAVDEAFRPTRRENRLAPAELVAAGQAPGGERHPLRRARLGLPGELEGPRPVEVALPVARRQVRGRPVLRQVARLDHLRVAFLGLAPQEVGGIGEVAGLVEDEEGRRVEVVEPGLRRDDARPDLGGVAGGQRAALDGLRTRGGVAGESLEVLPESVGQACGHAAEALADDGRPAGRQEELGGGEEGDLTDGLDAALVGRIEGAQGVDLVAEQLDPDGQGRRRREDVDDPAASRELAPAGDLDHGRVAALEELGDQRVEADPDARPERADVGRQVVGRDRRLDQRLDARHEDLGGARAPRGEGGDPCRGLIRDELAALVGQ